jgi:hypothetical protein
LLTNCAQQKHRQQLWQAVDVTRCVVAHVNEHVGYGLFAGVAMRSGDFLCRYGALATAADSVDRRNYCVQSGVPGVALDARAHRSLGAYVNHAPVAHANVALNCLFERGAEQVFLVTTRDVERGEQLLADYGRAYFAPAPRDQGADDERDDSAPSSCDAVLWGAPRGQLPTWLPALCFIGGNVSQK